MRIAGTMLAAALLYATGLACAASQGKPASQSAARTQEEIIVEGKRIEIKRRAYDFVSGVTHRGYMVESLARWNKPTCPLAAGIPSAQGEFILQRASQAVKAAKALLAGRKCNPTSTSS